MLNVGSICTAICQLACPKKIGQLLTFNSKRFPRKVIHMSSKKTRPDRSDLQIRLIQLPLMALILTLIVEWLDRGMSLPRLWAFLTQRPLYFLYNVLIVLTTLTFSELFKRRRAVLCTTTLLWLILGVVAFMVARDRTQPFSSVDILMIKDAFSLITIYFTWPQIILMFTAIFLIIVAIVMMFTRLKRRERFSRTASIIIFVGLVFICVMFSAIGVSSEFFPRRYSNLIDAYEDYGFPAIFCFTFGQQGIQKPEAYSTETVQEILGTLDTEGELTYPEFDEDDNLQHPNILFVQLESFFDVSTVVGGEYSQDPTPAFNRLCKNFPSGLLRVPTVGGGTANTEFEILTGMNVDYFGAGEYPYNTIMQQEAVESLATNLKAQGYTATALHNNTATFYSRNLVYPNMGFDRFVPLEYMREMKYTELGWARDGALTREILQALESTEGRDAIMCVAVESHGKYPETYEYKDGDIEVLALPEGVAYAAFQNYINVLPATDEFLKALIHALVRFDEPTVVVAYGDHLPALELSGDMLTTGTLYATRYVIWNNYGKTFEAPDLESYQLSANVLRQLGFSEGLICKYHQAADLTHTDEAYLDGLEQLQYDILYGDKQAFEGESPYVASDMTMGSVPVLVTDAVWEYGRLLVTGEGFTEFSKITVAGNPIETVYIDPEHLASPLDQNPPTRIAVAQVARDGTVLGRTNTIRLT